MTEYTASADVEVSAGTAFDYLSEVSNLPHYFPRITSAHLSDGGTVIVSAHIDTSSGERDVTGSAWLEVDRENHQLRWGADGSNNYSGHLALTERGADACTVEVSISTDNASSDRIQQGLNESVAAIATRLPEEQDAGGTARPGT